MYFIEYIDDKRWIFHGTATLVSYNLGAKLTQRVSNTLKIATKISIGVGVAFYLLVLFFGDSFIRLFSNQDGQLTELTFGAIQIYGLSYIFIGINLLASGYLTALGQPKYSLIVSLSYTFVFVLIGLSIFPQFLGASGLWWAVPFANMISILISFYFIKRINKKLEFL
ncbi:MAG: MATE family efflux transporter [Nitrosopumilus sp.]